MPHTWGCKYEWIKSETSNRSKLYTLQAVSLRSNKKCYVSTKLNLLLDKLIGTDAARRHVLTTGYAPFHVYTIS